MITQSKNKWTNVVETGRAPSLQYIPVRECAPSLQSDTNYTTVTFVTINH
jgi:hypothetical protein